MAARSTRASRASTSASPRASRRGPQTASPQTDVVIMDVSVQKVENDEGLYAQLDPAQVPSLAELFDQAKVAPNNLGPAVTFDHMTLIYGAEAVKPAPTGFKNLFDA